MIRQNADFTAILRNLRFPRPHGAIYVSMISLDSIPKSVIVYGNPAGGIKIADDSPVHPSLATDTLTLWEANTWCYSYDKATGMVVDSSWISPDSVMHSDDKVWYGPTVVYEIGRFITPYGINLDLGPDGFTWVYDITDYEPLFRDSVELSAGNNQELIDLRFTFIEGTTPRDLKRISKIWDGRTSYSYRALDNDDVLDDTLVVLDPAASTYRVKKRLTGHGHNSNDGSYPHRYEWKDNEHFIHVDGQQVASWHIWKAPDCAQNPVFPQGDTWLGSREGWCPGDVVHVTEFEITDYVIGDSVRLDYSITLVPASNQGMGSGSYVVAMHLMQYGAANHGLDAEVYDLISPNSWEYYSRINPICRDPKLVLRNAGATQLDSVDIQYSVRGGAPEGITWRGQLQFMDTVHVTLPISGQSFWNGTEPVFEVQRSNANDMQDDHADNDVYNAEFEYPDTIPSRFVILLATNNYPHENYYTLKDIDGDIVHQRDNMMDNNFYIDAMDLAPGCYTFEIYDSENDGLSYWAWPDEDSGFLRFNRATPGPVHKAFPSEFGHKLSYSFIADNTVRVADPGYDRLFQVYPNPTSGQLMIDVAGLPGAARISVINQLGQEVYHTDREVEHSLHLQVDLSEQSNGLYFVRLVHESTPYTKRVVLRRWSSCTWKFEMLGMAAANPWNWNFSAIRIRSSNWQPMMTGMSRASELKVRQMTMV